MTTTKETLIAARALIAEPGRWTKGIFARRADGSRTSDVSPFAVCWCPIGAISRASIGRSALRDNAAFLFGKATACLSIAEWNDAPERTHEEVLAAFDAAIQSCEER